MHSSGLTHLFMQISGKDKGGIFRCMQLPIHIHASRLMDFCMQKSDDDKSGYPVVDKVVALH
jgi:hypothetical protein